MRTSHGGRLPDGRETLSDAVYVKEWRELGEVMGDLFDMHCFAFDPDIALTGSLSRGNSNYSFYIPAKYALRIKKLMEVAGWDTKSTTSTKRRRT